MYKLYLCILFCIIILGTYFVGIRQGKTQCRADSALSINQKIIQKHNEDLEKKEKLNEKVINTATDDIRNILLKQYTIAE